MKKIEPSSYTLDDILRQIGKFGTYQIFVYFFICLGLLMSSAFALSYVFTVGEVNYRCPIPECESPNSDGDWSDLEYNPSWLENAIPFEKSLPKKCVRYLYIRNTTISDACAAENFDTNVQVDCFEAVFDDYESTIVNEVSSKNFI